MVKSIAAESAARLAAGAGDISHDTPRNDQGPAAQHNRVDLGTGDAAKVKPGPGVGAAGAAGAVISASTLDNQDSVEKKEDNHCLGALDLAAF
jgi:hypothetical protein